ncbi:MAG: TetR/AcrR family transcriptional regulator [Pseudomonadota bacterium]
MATETRAQFLDAAEALFAERGFYGVSIAAIADELGLTKQALLHHFGSKEKIYAAVLERISGRFEGLIPEAQSEGEPPALQLKQFFLKLHQMSQNSPLQTQLLMRELLDNKHRAPGAARWYLKPFLEKLIAMLQAIPRWRTVTEADAFAVLYQLLGSITYYAVSKTTLVGIFGQDGFAEKDAVFESRLSDLIDRALDCP